MKDLFVWRMLLRCVWENPLKNCFEVVHVFEAHKKIQQLCNLIYFMQIILARIQSHAATACSTINHFDENLYFFFVVFENVLENSWFTVVPNKEIWLPLVLVSVMCNHSKAYSITLASEFQNDHGKSSGFY